MAFLLSCSHEFEGSEPPLSHCEGVPVSIYRDTVHGAAAQGPSM